MQTMNNAPQAAASFVSSPGFKRTLAVLANVLVTGLTVGAYQAGNGYLAQKQAEAAQSTQAQITNQLKAGMKAGQVVTFAGDDPLECACQCQRPAAAQPAPVATPTTPAAPTAPKK